MTFSAADIPDLTGKICLVTGGTNGIGLITAVELARKNANVVITARSNEKGETAVKAIKEASGKEQVSFVLMENSDLKTAITCANEFKKRHKNLHILINNAGVFCPGFKLCDGIESQMMINHLSHFVLTELLSDLIINSAPARIVIVSSEAALAVSKFDGNFDYLNKEENYSGLKKDAYDVSKMANVLHAIELSKRLPSNVYVNSLHPGQVRTNIVTKVNIPGFVKFLFGIYSKLAFISAEDGALTQLYLATHPDVEKLNIKAKYYYPIAVDKPLKNIPAVDENLAKTLWEWSENHAKRILGNDWRKLNT